MAYKTDNQIMADVIGVINGWLSVSGQTGWKVAQAFQPRPMGLHDKMILLSHIYTRQVGFQKGYDQDLPNTSGGGMTFTHIEDWLEEVRLQVSCFCNRKPGSDTITTWTAEDMAKRLVAYFNGTAGINAFYALGYGKLRRDVCRVRTFVNDSENFQLVPNFDLVLIHEQTVETAAIPAQFGGLQIVGF